MALDPDEYFFVVLNMPGNGLSTSPSNTPPPYGKARFPDVAFYDNVSLQKLVTEHFGIERLALVTSWSMGVGQTYQWAVVLPASLGVRQDLVRPLDLLETLLSTGVFGVRSGWYFQTNL
jgi:homoserine acetyltransferase